MGLPIWSRSNLVAIPPYTLWHYRHHPSCRWNDASHSYMAPLE